MLLEVGTAIIDITPPLGTPMAGYWYLRRVTGILDPLFARAMFLKMGEGSVAIVALDLCCLPKTVFEASAERIQWACGLPSKALIFSCNHTHTGPATIPLMNIEEHSAEYQRFLVERLAHVITTAQQHLTPTRLSISETRVPGVAFNRRLLAPDGRVSTNKPDTSVASCSPAGPVDDHLRVLYAESLEGQPLATLVNFALHPDTTAGSLVSADFPGVLAEQLSNLLPGSPQVLFLNGPCGDINHLNPERPEKAYSHANAIRIGKMLANSAYQALHKRTWLEPDTLTVERQAVELRVRSPDSHELISARQILETHTGPATKALTRAKSLLEINERAGESFNTTISALRLGNLGILGLPGEVFTQLGLEIRSRAPFAQTIITGLTNDYIGYIPTSQAFQQGGYETNTGRTSFIEENGGEKLVNAALQLLLSL